MPYRNIARIFSSLRIALGFAELLLPERVGRIWSGTERAPRTALMRSLGARDVALGSGTLLAALRSGGKARPWLLAAVVADVADAVATAVAYKRAPADGRRLALVLALFSAILSSRLAAAVE